MLETRGRQRRRECGNGHRTVTVELLKAVASGMGLGRIAAATAEAVRGARARELARGRAARVKSLASKGVSKTHIARAVGISEARVRQILKGA